MLSAQMLVAIDPRALPVAPQAAGALNAALAEFAIADAQEQAALLAVCTVETGGWRVREEILRYTTAAQLLKIFPHAFADAAAALPYLAAPQKLANRVYAGRNGNGDEASGDGWRFRGRGYIQITGRANYARCMLALFGNAQAEPDLLLTPGEAARSAAWFWVEGRCGAALRRGGMDAVTRIVNGPGMAGAAERRAFYAKALTVLGGAG
jgi:putative chitinase